MIEPVYTTTDVHGNELTEAEQEWCKNNNDLYPESFASFNWKSKQSRETWGDLLDQAAEAKREAEWRSVISDETDRSIAIIHINNYNREKWLRRVSDHDLHYRDIRYTGHYEGFSHKFVPIDENDPERVTYAVIAQNKDLADKVKEAELEWDSRDKHDFVGENLGFPECCRDFFNDVWLGDQRIDPLYENSCNDKSAVAVDGNHEHVCVEDITPWNNIMYRYWGWSFLTHIPCSTDCEKSVDIAKSRGEIMKETGYKDAANAMYNWLSEPMLWEADKGIINVRNQHITARTGGDYYHSPKRVIWGEEHDAGGSIV